jgi:hypothetical protein
VPDFFKPGRGFVVSGKKNLKWCPVGDLGEELSARTKGQPELMRGVALKLEGNLLHGRRKVGGDSDLHLIGERRRGKQ